MKNEVTFDITYPDEEEIRAAQLACCGRACKECESPAEYAWRKRSVDMSILLEMAIENELTETEKIIVENIWFNALSFSEVARERGVSPSSIIQTSERAVEKLKNVLQYVVYYQQNVVDKSIVPSVLARAKVIASAKKINSAEIGDRIKNLRLSRAMSLSMSAKALGISKQRIDSIEKGEMLRTDELLIFSEFFDVTTDYILKGDNHV